MGIAGKADLRVEEKDCSLAEFYVADEVFTTGTMGALSWVRKIDGRIIGQGEKGPQVTLLQKHYQQEVEVAAVAVP
jgi:branched-chain amino acid aminotransferase